MASCARGPAADTVRVSPNRAPSATRFVRLRALTAGPPPAFATRTSASKLRAVSTKRAAGRAWSPIALRTASSAVTSASAPALSSPDEAFPSSAIWLVFIASAPRASAATSSSDAPPPAAAAAATAPSTSGAALSRTGPGAPSSISTANSALISALPRSINTSTPSGDMARSIAARTRSASVPRTPSSSIPPAASMASSSPPISRARRTTPWARTSLWETTTIPTNPFPLRPLVP